MRHTGCKKAKSHWMIQHCPMLVTKCTMQPSFLHTVSHSMSVNLLMVFLVCWFSPPSQNWVDTSYNTELDILSSEHMHFRQFFFHFY